MTRLIVDSLSHNDSPNEKSKLVNELKEKTEKITDLEKEIQIYKAALGIRN
ncbi:hypothetical protein OMO38_16850 [Chryseobacterium sp. 09-1422]|uniref:Transposase n=1 Tax=Chryseobacterium kimseyorum TaxID=2984028 RepID=A0ABT3I2X3_9FLAO|nr:hypothetical protein [Chryseobacterium kimseyorum]MCW3170198.1 hypothetical protein [Chryseobacterium kimseyorum]